MKDENDRNTEYKRKNYQSWTDENGGKRQLMKYENSWKQECKDDEDDGSLKARKGDNNGKKKKYLVRMKEEVSLL